MRLFNPITMTEVIPGLHEVKDAIELADDNWFFTMLSIPKGQRLSIDSEGNPILICDVFPENY